MKVEYSRKAQQFYRRSHSPNGREWVEVDDDAPVHAVLLNHPKRYRRFRTRELVHMASVRYLGRFDSVTAVCGRSVRVIYPMGFDASEDEVCQTCKSMLTLRPLIGEDDFWRQVDDAAARESLFESKRRHKHEQKKAPVAHPPQSDVEDQPNRLQELMSRADDEADDDGWRTSMFEGLLQKDSQEHPPEADDRGA